MYGNVFLLEGHNTSKKKIIIRPQTVRDQRLDQRYIFISFTVFFIICWGLFFSLWHNIGLSDASCIPHIS